MNISQSLIDTLETELSRLQYLTKDLLDSVKTKLINIKSIQREQEYEAILEERKQRPQAIAEKTSVEKEKSSLLSKLLLGGGLAAAGIGGSLFSGNTEASTNRDLKRNDNKELTQIAISKEVTIEGKSLLDAISVKESQGRYDVIVGEGSEQGLTEEDKAANRKKGYERAPATFSDFSKHPGIIGMRTNNGPSTAAGRYQFTKTTWEGLVKKHPDLTDFSPENQDKAAWYLAQEEYLKDTGQNLQEDLETADANTFAKIEESLKNRWTSLTGGIETNQTNEGFRQAYTDALKVQQQTQTAKASEIENPQAKVEPIRESPINNNNVKQIAESKQKPNVKTVTNNITRETIVTQIAQQTVSGSDTTVSDSLPSPDELKRQYRSLA
jgi:muramidase (phage lysozyme)